LLEQKYADIKKKPKLVENGMVIFKLHRKLRPFS